MRYYVDTLSASYVEDALTKMKQIVEKGDVLVTSETALDVKAFREDPNWFRECVEKGSIVIELWNDADTMVQKEFQWSSFDGFITEPVQDFRALLGKYFYHEWVLMAAIYWLMEDYGKPRGTCEMGKFEGNKPLTEEEAAELGVAVDATRTEILKVCLEKGIDFSIYTLRYIEAIKNQHRCDAVFI